MGWLASYKKHTVGVDTSSDAEVTSLRTPDKNHDTSSSSSSNTTMTIEELEKSEPDDSINLELAENTDADDTDITKVGASVKDRRGKNLQISHKKRDQKLNQNLTVETQMLNCAEK